MVYSRVPNLLGNTNGVVWSVCCRNDKRSLRGCIWCGNRLILYCADDDDDTDGRYRQLRCWPNEIGSNVFDLDECQDLPRTRESGYTFLFFVFIWGRRLLKCNISGNENNAKHCERSAPQFSNPDRIRRKLDA